MQGGDGRLRKRGRKGIESTNIITREDDQDDTISLFFTFGLFAQVDWAQNTGEDALS
jgi:hypothetical protein